MANPSDELRVTFRGGFTARLDVVLTLLALQTRGARFLPMPDGGFKVVPRSVLTDADRDLLRAHRDEARAVVRYQADDSHIFSDSTRAQAQRLPSASERIA